MDDAIIIPFLWVNKWRIRELSNFTKVTDRMSGADGWRQDSYIKSMFYVLLFRSALQPLGERFIQVKKQLYGEYILDSRVQFKHVKRL